MPSPSRTQYLDVKAAHPDAIVLFRMGDFYETFDEDARTAARVLQIALTQRDMGQGEVVPLAGIPYHALDTYLARLIRAGHRVAICEQTSEPDGRRLVERAVVRVVTPGTVLEPALLEAQANNYLAALVLDGDTVGLAYVDVTTGEFATTQVPASQAAQELARVAPVELLVAKADAEAARAVVGEGGSLGAITLLSRTALAPHAARARLLEHFGAASLEAYGCDRLPLATAAAGTIVEYLAETNRAALPLLTGLRTESPGGFMALDAQTRRNLELFEGGRWTAPAGLRKEQSLYAVLNLTKTPMGARLLRRWLGQPLLDLAELARRLDVVAWLHESGVRRGRLATALGEVSDLERLLGRASADVAAPREAVGLRRSLQQVAVIKPLVAEAGPTLAWVDAGLHPCGDTVALLVSAIADDPQGEPGAGGVIRDGFSHDLDVLRAAARDATGYLAGLERRERERTGIPSLKVGYNRVFGYYLEVTTSHLAKVPADYTRRQTLTNAERYVTPELKEHEERVLDARERMETLEATLYRQVCAQVAADAPRITRTAQELATLDVLLALAEAASRHGYVRPALDDGDAIVIEDGRHPVVERALPAGTFVPNDTRLSCSGEQLVVLTGPNMAGKSTYLRQVALITLMAQVGSFVPARAARVGLVDRIFTRVGLQDDLTAGQSTFMVEMVETAAILHQATRRSLVILDEIGRGTSTYDGLSIAQAVAEHIHSAPRLGCRTLFATHYHELTALAERLPRVRNENVAVAEEGGSVVFLHRIVPGGADRSYGVHVGQLAGLPRGVVRRAWELLAEHEAAAGAGDGAAGKPRAKRAAPAGQLALAGLGGAVPPSSPALDALRALDLDGLSPIEALNKLYELKKQAGEG